MSELPKQWAVAQLGEINQFASGNIDPSSFSSERFELYSVPSFPSGKPEFPLGSEIGSTKQLVAPNDVLISKINPRINRVWQVGPTTKWRQIASSEWIAFRNAAFDSRYFKHYFSSSEFRDRLCADVTGVGGSLTRAQPKRVATFQIPIAPAAEQKRIADKLDTVLTRVDAVNTRLARVAPLLKRFRQSVLAAATSGRLTEDWRGGRAVNETWRVIPLGKYVENHDGARVPISETLRTERRGAYPYYGASGVIDTIDGFTHEGKFVLIGEDGANLVTRSKPIAFIATGKIWVNNHAHVLKCKEGASDEYLAYYINSIDLTPYVSGSAQPKLNQKNLNTIPVPVPPTEEQTEIVRRVETLFAFADRLEARLAQAQTAATRLTPALLAKAFRGELVPQDPNDEPAAELLRRLQAERATAPKASAGRGRKAAVRSEG